MFTPNDTVRKHFDTVHTLFTHYDMVDTHFDTVGHCSLIIPSSLKFTYCSHAMTQFTLTLTQLTHYSQNITQFSHTLTQFTHSSHSRA